MVVFSSRSLSLETPQSIALSLTVLSSPQLVSRMLVLHRFLLLALSLLRPNDAAFAFVFHAPSNLPCRSSALRRFSARFLRPGPLKLASSDSENASGGSETSQSIPLLQESAISSTDSTDNDPALDISPAEFEASTAVMISQNQRRVLIEELGYRRIEVEEMRVELAAPVIAKRLQRPPSGMPAAWYRPAEESAMMKKLQSESRYSLKVPLLGISLVLFGKGFGDALITAIKVNSGFPGASLAAEFLGVPVLAIDAACIVAGGLLGTWTWKTMRD